MSSDNHHSHTPSTAGGGINSTELLPSPPENKPVEINIDSDFIVILAALLCGLICVLGLVAVARCAWIRRITNSSPPHPHPNKGLKKKVIQSLPKFNYTPQTSGKFSECPICLMEFTIGDEIRVLPQCDHGFHVECVDTWLGSHSSCPSCRQIPVASRCQNYGELPVAEAIGDRSALNDHHVNAFVP
ncbi:unnamed protein product [Withania somnifera]